jgi:hypothetical protein
VRGHLVAGLPALLRRLEAFENLAAAAEPSVLCRLLGDENGDVVLLVPEVSDGRGVAGLER